jgi:hypothetical protein
MLKLQEAEAQFAHTGLIALHALFFRVNPGLQVAQLVVLAHCQQLVTGQFGMQVLSAVFIVYPVMQIEQLLLVRQAEQPTKLHVIVVEIGRQTANFIFN